MKTIDKLSLALQGVSNNKFRSFLTLLGIIIGVVAVILMVSLGSGTKNVVSGQFSSLYQRQVYLGSNWNLSYQERGSLTLEDEKYLEASILGLNDAVPFLRTYLPVKFAKREENFTVAGVNQRGIELTSLLLEYGRDISEEDISGRERVAIVGGKILERLSEQQDYSAYLGEKISIGGEEFIIIGILGEANSTFSLPNSSVLVPFTTFLNIWRRQNNNQVDYYLLTYDQKVSEKDIIAQAYYVLDQKYGKTRKGQSRFILQGLQEDMDVTNRVISVFTYVLGGIAAISLVVGGVGIMNIMLVTVKERTREIGLRMAIGATSEDIQQQFLLEAIILTVGGGLLGALFGSLLAALVNLVLSYQFDWWQGSIPLWVIFLSFGVTVAIGLIFGFYPAYRASKLDPIEALRYE